MIVLDTNVVSEAMRPAPDPSVLGWLNDQPAETLCITSVTLAELLFGIACLPAGRRKQALGAVLEGLTALFSHNVLPFDAEAARCYADLARAAKTGRLAFPVPDAYIASIAMARGFLVASRDATAFAAAGVGVIDPWQVRA